MKKYFYDLETHIVINLDNFVDEGESVTEKLGADFRWKDLLRLRIEIDKTNKVLHITGATLHNINQKTHIPLKINAF